MAVILFTASHPHQTPRIETNGGLVLGQRRRRWTNAEPTLVQ